MTTTSNVSPSNNRQTLAGVLGRGAQIAILLLVQAAILFIGSGHVDWPWAWVFLALYLVSIAVNSAFMLRNSLETVAERGNARFAKDWDKLL